jgi:hypothetical protein
MVLPRASVIVRLTTPEVKTPPGGLFWGVAVLKSKIVTAAWLGRASNPKELATSRGALMARIDLIMTIAESERWKGTRKIARKIS